MGEMASGEQVTVKPVGKENLRAQNSTEEQYTETKEES